MQRSPLKTNFFDDNFRQIFFPSVFFFCLREKIVKTARKFTTCVRVNYFNLFTWNWKRVYVKNITCSLLKFLYFFSFLYGYKINSYVKYLNFDTPFQLKIKSTLEKIKKCFREKFGLHVKRWNNLCVKHNFPSVTKIIKRPKMAFTGYFYFHGKI